MAKDLFFKCIDDAITRLHYIDFVMLPYINKLKSNKNYDEKYCNEIECLREKVNVLHDDMLDFLNRYKSNMDVGYNPLCKKPRSNNKITLK